MSFPRYTETGRKWTKEYLNIQINEIEKNAPLADWVPMFKELLAYIFELEERISDLETKKRA